MKEEQTWLHKLAFGSTKTDGRAHLFDNIKFILIILVVMGHFIDDLTEFKPQEQPEELNDLLKGIFIFIYSFHMPAFLFVSGLFAKKHTDRINWQPVKVNILLGMMLKIVVGIGQMLYCTEQMDGYFSLLGGNGVFWYLFVLAAFYVLTYALRNVDARFTMVLSVLLALMIGYDNEIDEWLSLSRIVVFFPFYFAGYCLEPASVQSFCKRWYIRILSAAGLLTWGYVCFFRFEDIKYLRRLFTGRNPYKAVQLPNTEFWDRGFAMMISAAMIVVLISLTPGIVMPFFTKYGSRTLQVYFWHRPLLYYIVYTEIFEQCIQVKLPNHWWWAALLISVAVTYLLSYEMFGRPLKHCIKMMKKPPAQTEKTSGESTG